MANAQAAGRPYTGKHSDVDWFMAMKQQQMRGMATAKMARDKRIADENAAIAQAEAAGVEARAGMGRTLQISATMRAAQSAAKATEDALGDSVQGDPETSLGLAGERKLKPRAGRFAFGSRVGVNI